MLTFLLGVPSFDLGVCEQLMESKTGYDIHMHRQTSKSDRKLSFLPSRKNSISKGLAGTTYVNRLPSPRTPPSIAEVASPDTETLRLK